MVPIFNHTNWGEEFVEFELSRHQEMMDIERAQWYDEYLDFEESKRDAFLDETDTRELEHHD